MSQLLFDVPKLLAHEPSQEAAAADNEVCSSCKESQVPIPAREHWMASNEFKAGVLVTQPESVCPEKCTTRPWVQMWLSATHLRSGVDAHCSVSTFSWWQTCTAAFEARVVLAIISAVAWHLEHVNQDWPRCHLWGLRRQPTKGFVHCGYLWLNQLARAGWSTYKVLLALLGLGTWTRCSWGKRGLEVPASEHPTGSPAQVCAADWGRSPCPYWRSCCTAFSRDPRCQHRGQSLLSHMLGKRVHSPRAGGSQEKTQGTSGFWGWKAEHAELELSAWVLH